MTDLRTDSSESFGKNGIASCGPLNVMFGAIIAGGILMSSIAVLNSTVPPYLPYLCLIPVFLWMYATWRIQVSSAIAVGKNSPFTQIRAVLLGFLGSPFTAILSIVALFCLQWALAQLSGLIIDVIPADLPIIQTAQNLVTEHATIIEIVLSVAVIFLANQTIMRQASLPVQQAGGVKRGASIAGLVTGLCISVPASMWLLRDSSMAFAVGLEQDWFASLLLALSLAMLVALAVLAAVRSSLTSQLRAAKLDQTGCSVQFYSEPVDGRARISSETQDEQHAA